MLSNLILLTCLNRYLLVLCYTIVISSLNRLNFMSEANKVVGRKSKVGTHGRASVLQNRNASTIQRFCFPD